MHHGHYQATKQWQISLKLIISVAAKQNHALLHWHFESSRPYVLNYLVSL
jgi:hypothetical protein